MVNVIILGVVFVILGSAITYIVVQKKKGVKCIGCSAGGNCHCGHQQHQPSHGHKNNSCNCCCH